MRFKGLKLELLVEWAKSVGVDVPEPLGSGKDVSRWYEEERYEDIVWHLRRDLEILRTIDLNHGRIYEVLGRAKQY